MINDEMKEKLEVLRMQAWQHYRKFVDDMGPYVWQRWASTGVFALLFLWRVGSVHGFYLVTYALGIFLLNQLMLFLSPKVDPVGEESLPLPLSNSLDDDFRPFVRALPEKEFWLRSTIALLISMFCTFLPFLNIPVFWPILVIYFVCLFPVSITFFFCMCFVLTFLFCLCNSPYVRHDEEPDCTHDQVQVSSVGVWQEKVCASSGAQALF